MQDSLVATYTGLGHLATSAQRAVGNTSSGNVQVETSYSAYSYDALANGYKTTSSTYTSTRNDSFIGGQAWSWGLKGGTSTFAPLTGRLLSSAQGNHSDQFVYDSAGNTVFQWGADTQQHYSDLASYYGADGKLRTVDRRNLTGIADGKSVWEEYRYDALGRRVWVRTLNWCSSVSYGACSLNLVRRTVWDGDQALYEIQMQESEQENDSVPTQTGSLGSDMYDPNPLTGRVLHTYGPGIDQPLSTIRMAFANAPGGSGFHRWQQFAVIPIWDDRGRAPYVVFANGTRTRCESGAPVCLGTYWVLGWRAYGSRSNGAVTSTSSQAAWLGNVLEDHHDASGLLYRRNRYYNPQTGRFTQEDPIGLAGGMNVYGFAEGDPATYADPYGLKIMYHGATREESERMRRALRWVAARSATFRAVFNALATSKSVVVHLGPNFGLPCYNTTTGICTFAWAFHPGETLSQMGPFRSDEQYALDMAHELYHAAAILRNRVKTDVNPDCGSADYFGKAEPCAQEYDRQTKREVEQSTGRTPEEK
jgi:RHS repeat-associated protein